MAAPVLSTRPRPQDLRALPGPRARRAITADERVTSPSYTRVYPLAVKRGRGAIIEDLDGHRFLDFTAGIAVCATGHCHPKVVRAIRRQAGQLLHMSGTDFYYEPFQQLAHELAELAPGRFRKRVLFTNSGAESVEAAFKLARYHTKRPRMIAFLGAFHGRTLGALSLCGSKVEQVKGFAPLIPDVTHVPYGYCFRCPYHLTYPSCQVDCVKILERELFKETVPPDEVAAIVVEPIQGEGGYIVPPAGYFQALRELCDRHKILLIVDEVQSGMGRTGRMFAIEHWGVVPDIICLAKGIASGLPLGAMIARAEIMTWGPGSHASTFGGNPLSCVAALETLRLLRGGLMRNAAVVGRYLIQRLRALQAKYAVIGDVRGMGLMVGIELVEDRARMVPAHDLRNAVVQRCFQQGLLLLGCGQSGIRFSPPLVITRRDVDRACAIVDRALAECHP